MNHHKGFAAVTALLIILGLVVLGGVGYVALKPNILLKAPTEENTQTAPEADQGASAKTSISWQFTDAGEIEATPYTNVFVTINGKVQDVGKYVGSCTELGANGGVDGKGLLTGELSAAQCYFAGGGDEIGVFANEDGGYDVMVGELQEPVEGGDGFRGNFKVKITL